MKHTKFWSCLIAFVLLVSCVAGIFVVGADAESTVVYYTLGEVEMEGSEHYGTLSEALAALKAKDKAWGADESVEIQFKGDISGGTQDGILFGLTTVWREDGTKLPITIRGVDTKTARDAYIYLDGAGGWYACANDYTFINLTLPVGDQLTEFYAGSGNIRFENVHFKQQNITIPTSAEQKVEYRLMKAVAEAIAQRNNADLLPAGDAWMDLIENNPDIGNNLSRSQKKDRPEGDYKHDGDIGGGMYVNACVWYEVLTKKSCVGHTWRPTKELVGYILDETIVDELQQAAHAAVVGVYGADYYDDTYSADLNGDGELNILNIGSSNGYYYVDELCQMLTADGLTARVCTAYHSGVPIAEQWTWAAGTAKGDYQFRIYEADTNTAEEISNPDAKGVNFDYFQTKFAWDSITFYQTAGPFDDYGLTEEKYDYAYGKILAGCARADNLYEFMRQTNPNARYTWYQVCPNPVGSPGVSTSLDAKSGRFYADNCTQEVFAGWPELEEGEKVQTSITFGPGTTYSGSEVKHYIAAVGYMQDYAGDPLTDQTAAEIKYMDAAASYGNIPDIRPVDVEASIVIDGGTAYRLSVHNGYAPTDGKVLMNGGSVYVIDGDNNTSSVTESFYGDTEIKVMGGTVTGSVFGTYDANLKGDLSIEIGGDAVVDSSIRGTFGGVVDGNVYMTVSGNAQIKGDNSNLHSFYGGGNATGEIVNTVSGGTLTGTYFGIRDGGKGKTIVNNITGGTINGDFYGGHYSTTKIGQVVNNFSGGAITGTTYAGCRQDSTSCAITGLPIELDGKTVTASIVNNISGTTFGTAVTGEDGKVTRTGDFFGSSVNGTVNDIYNIITGGTFNYRFYGSNSKKTVGNVTTKVSGDAYFGSAFHAMGYDASSSASKGKTLTVEIKGGTFNSTAYYCGQILYERVANIVVDGGTVHGTVYAGGYNSSAKEINLTVKSGTFNDYFYGGIYNAGTGVNPKKINITIEGGTFNGAFFGGSRGVRTGDVHVIVRGNPVFNKNFAPGGWNKLAGELTEADIVTGNVTTELYGGTFTNVYCGSSTGTVGNITTTVDGANITGLFYGAYGGTMGDVNTTIKSGTFGGTVYLGPWGGTCASVTSNISGGTFKNVTKKDSSGNVVSLNTFNGGGKGKVTGDITTNITNGTFDSHVLLGSASTVGGSVINKISGGTFALTSCGAGKGAITGNVENTISGTANFKKGFYGGYSLSEAHTVGGNIINKVEQGPETNRPYFGRSPAYRVSKDGSSVTSVYNISNSNYGFVGAGYYKNSTVTGYVQNDISGGYFYGHWHGGGASGKVNGVDADGYSIVNNVSGGTFDYYYYGGCMSDFSLVGGIKNEISGGTFLDDFSATHRAGLSNSLTSTSFSNNINTHIYGNPVFESYICGVARGWNTDQAARIRYLGDAVLTIEGGTFKGDIYGLSNYGGFHDENRPGARIEEDGSVTVNINGGTFEGEIFATSPVFDATLYHEGCFATVNIAPTKGDVAILKAVGSRFANEIFNLQGGDNKLMLGADASVTANSATGDVKLGQKDTWKKQVYVTLPEGNDAVVTVTGPHCLDKAGESVVAVKGGIQLFGATMILTDRVAVRALFDKASVEGLENFTFSFKMGEEVLAEGTKADLKPYGDAYYGVVLAKIGANDFTNNVILSGDLVWEKEFSIKGLAILAETAWADNDKGIALAKAMQNFATIVADPEAELPHTLAPDMSLVEGFTASGSIGTDTAFAVTGKGLVMGNAVGIRIYGTADCDVTNDYFTIKVNGTDVTDKVVITADGNNAYTVDLYVNAKSMSSALKIEIIEKATGNSCLTLTDRVDAIAASYPETHEKYDLVQQLLVYIQAAVAYASAL